ncbi:MAG: ribosome recycling factor [Candidatus Neomarinimicrobiota bacterium]|jgi:ribosome recycling factor|nr:ribosome recycling factor [Candidatus Neomarinimicrobiota bacterium]MED5433360.1 ribosome recycling factor [Candidatus Neomarinimicrobiota bacterium]HJL92655.1 ribosome recycling factor [Woeseiaceae bacterium]|tara:strand:- start:32 stop:589 length:558 start_codon:yes stop_codon:yes gene_type:complete
MFEEIKKETKQKMSQSIEHAKSELLKVRTGRANPDLLNSIQVEYYGTMTPLNQVSTITVPEPRMISLQPFEKTLIPIIEKAIMDSNLGLTPNNNGNTVLVPIPSLTEERRLELIKYVHQLIEEGRIVVRNIRRDSIHNVKEFGKDEHISEDETRRQEGEIQTLTDEHISILNELQELKENELKEF